jgi:uncharacterized protein YbjT (DUF2867 family)
MNSRTTLVLGGTGKTGRRVAERLRARGLAVRLGSRAGTPPFDWEAPGTWPAVLQNAGAAYISYYPDIAVPGAADTIRSFTNLAVASGVSRLVLLSGRGEVEAQRSEQVVRDAGAEWTIVRASWFSQNFSESFLLEPVLSGEVVLPAGAVGEPFVDADDIADVVVAALTEDRHSGQVYELTGPRLLTFAGAVAEIARATHREIRYVQVPIDVYVSMLEGVGVPPAFTSIISYLFTEVLDGRNALVADGVTRALGRPARDFTDYARETAATGVWNADVAAASVMAVK